MSDWWNLENDTRNILVTSYEDVGHVYLQGRYKDAISKSLVSVMPTRILLVLVLIDFNN